jgi:hypothetical protein
MSIVKITTPLEKADQLNDGFYTCGNYIAVIDAAKPNSDDFTVIAIIDHNKSIEPIREIVIRERLTPEEWEKTLKEIAEYYNIEKGN